MEAFTLSSIADNNHREYTCSAQDRPYLACLDIASPLTLDSSINQTRPITSAYELAVSLSNMYVSASEHSTQLFGSSIVCEDGKTRGDGVINSLDMIVLLWYQFRVPPYNSLSGSPFGVFTVNGESDVGRRCEDTITRQQYAAAYDIESPCTVPTNLRRRMSVQDDVRTTVTPYVHRTLDSGTWYHIRITNIQLAIEISIQGVDSDITVPLSNMPSPLTSGSDAPLDSSRYEVRYARHAEYDNGDTSNTDCSPMMGLIAGMAMYRSTVAVGQTPIKSSTTEDFTLLCAFDLYIYAPATYDDTIRINPGVISLGGVTGSQTVLVGSTVNAPFDFTALSMSPPPPPATHGGSSPSLPPLSPPSSSSPMPVWVIVVIVLSIVTLCGAGAVGFVRTRGVRRPVRSVTNITRPQMNNTRKHVRPEKNTKTARR